MRISRVKIENYRAIQDFDKEFDSITAFMGYNGGGKSSILRAIDWFFNGGELDEDDFHLAVGPMANRAERIRVQITFADLTESDRTVFGPYGRGEEMRLTREASINGETKLFGHPLSCPEFASVREDSRSPSKKKKLDDIVQDPKFSNFPEYSHLTKAAEINGLLDKWEADPKNYHLLEERDAEEANHFFGATGTHTLKSKSNFIFVPAAPDLTAEFQSDVRDSAISLLTGALLKEVFTKSVDSWQQENQEVLQSLEDRVRSEADGQLSELSANVNKHLEAYLPGAQFNLTVALDDWKPKAQPIAYSNLSMAERSFGLESHGHGVQRAALLALLQAVAETRSSKSHNEDELGSRLIVCIEEPEVYQHPVQARMLAKSFQDAAESNNIQFIYATHSPYFVSPEFLDSTYRVVPSSGGAIAQGATLDTGLKKKKNELSKYFRKAIVEGLFARACLIVEGGTDQFVFDSIRVGNKTLAEQGIAVINAEGTNSLWTIAKIIASYGVPIHILRDGDSSTTRADNSESKLASWQAQVTKFVEEANNSGFGEGLEDFLWKPDGRGAFGKYCTILSDDLEAELLQWPSFMHQASELGMQRDLRKNKQAGPYGIAVELADSEDQPEVFKKVFHAVLSLADLGVQKPLDNSLVYD